MIQGHIHSFRGTDERGSRDQLVFWDAKDNLNSIRLLQDDKALFYRLAHSTEPLLYTWLFPCRLVRYESGPNLYWNDSEAAFWITQSIPDSDRDKANSSLRLTFWEDPLNLYKKRFTSCVSCVNTVLSLRKSTWIAYSAHFVIFFLFLLGTHRSRCLFGYCGLVGLEFDIWKDFSRVDVVA